MVMNINPRSLRPPVMDEQEKKREEHSRHQKQAADAEMLQREIASGEGMRIIQDMAADFENEINSLALDMTLDQMQLAIGRICYIRDRINGWVPKIKLGRRVKEKLFAGLMKVVE